MARPRSIGILLLLLAVSALLVSHLVHASPDPKADEADDDEDLSFLEEETDKPAATAHETHHGRGEEDEEEEDEVPPEGFAPTGYGEGSYDAPPPVEDKDVVVLTDSNFTELVSKRKHVLVEFYAPWCGHCQALAPEYAAAATYVKEEMAEDDVVLAKVDATEENDLAQKYDIQGFPTLLFFIDGEHKPYAGGRTKDAIISWIKKKVGPAIHTIATVEEGRKILDSENKVVLGFFDSLEGTESQELASASKLEDDVAFYQTTSSDVAKLFNIDASSKHPSLVMLKKEAEKVSFYDGSFTKSGILEFVVGNKLPLVTYLSRESAQDVFGSSIKMQFLLFATAHDSKTIIPTFQEVAKLFKGKILFVYVELDNEDIGKPVSDYFGVTGDKPKILAYTGNEDGKKYIFDGKLTSDAIKVFGEDFLKEKLKPFYKSDPIPESNDGDVKIVVGNNFDEIVLNESKDVLLEIYAPWCGHCQSLEPTYNKLAKHLRDIDSLVIAKMDGTTNEHPRAKADGFPTLLFFPAGSKGFDPIAVETDRTVVAFYKFIKKHASIPFKLQKPAAAKSETSAIIEPESKTPKGETKDEL